jgi:hypothetical protein
MASTDAFRQQLIASLRGGQAFETFDTIVGEIPSALRGVVPDRADRSAWQILDHMRISLADILAFSTKADYREMNWPDDYWPKSPLPPLPDSWDNAAAAFLEDRKALEALVGDAAKDLFGPLPFGRGQSLLHEALLAVEHQSYHLGEMVVLRQRLLG